MEGQGDSFDPDLGAGFTATGSQLGIDDHIGGTMQIIGQPDFPVILTSLSDDTVGAGLQPDGQTLTDTNNNGWTTLARGRRLAQRAFGAVRQRPQRRADARDGNADLGGTRRERHARLGPAPGRSGTV